MITLALASLGGMAQAQTVYEAAKLNEEDIDGTARYVGMGGAMNALGGDISVMKSNPAGIGIFRSNDLSLSFSYVNTATGSEAGRKGGMSFDDIGLVYANRVSGSGLLRFINIGFNYHKRRNFNNRTVSRRGGAGFNKSQTYQFANMATQGTNRYGEPGYDPDQLDAKETFVTSNPYVGWLPAMAYQACLIDPVYYENEGRYEFDGEYTPYMQSGLFTSVDNYYESEESGWVNDYDFNISFNFSDRLYFGATLTASDVRYRKTSLYKEDFYDDTTSPVYYGGGYDLKNYFSTKGSGLGFSAGVIYRPLSSMRVAFSFATPTIYWLNDYQESSIAYDVDAVIEGSVQQVSGEVFPVDGHGNFIPYEYSYQVVTPWKLNVAVGGTLLNCLAFDAEYEFKNSAKTKLRDMDGIKLVYENDAMSSWFKGQHTFRAGVEAKPLPMLALRVGYNYTTALFDAFDASNADANAYKSLSPSAARTDTEYSNSYAKQSISAGLGFRSRYFYADVAYQYSMYKQDFFEYDDVALLPVNLKTDRHQLLFTLGCRF